MATKQRNAQDLTLRNLRAQKARIADLERQVKKIKKVVGIMATWIAQTPAGEPVLSLDNVAQLKEKIK